MDHILHPHTYDIKDSHLQDTCPLLKRLVAPLKITYELENFFSICKMERFISILFLLSYHKISFSWLRRLAFSTLIYTIDVRNSTTDTFQSNWRILKINKSANLMILVHCYGTHLPILYVKKPINEVVSSSLSRKLWFWEYTMERFISMLSCHVQNNKDSTALWDTSRIGHQAKLIGLIADVQKIMLEWKTL